MPDPWVTVGAVILGGLVTAAVGEWQAGRRFRRELELHNRQQLHWVDQQFWMRKADTYIRICEILWEEMAYAADYEDYLHSIPSNKKPPEVRIDWKDRRENLRQQSEIGGVFLSEQAIAQLRKFNKEYSTAIDQIDIDEIVDAVYKASKDCLDSILAIARTDLRMTSVVMKVPTDP